MERHQLGGTVGSVSVGESSRQCGSSKVLKRVRGKLEIKLEFTALVAEGAAKGLYASGVQVNFSVS